MLELLIQGVTSNRELAERLVVSENTVKYHLRNILDKLHLQNRAQVISYALRYGILDPPTPIPPEGTPLPVRPMARGTESAAPGGAVAGRTA